MEKRIVLIGAGSAQFGYGTIGDIVIHKSKALALQALLVDPIVSQSDRLEELLDTMIAYQEKWLGYLR